MRKRRNNTSSWSSNYSGRGYAILAFVKASEISTGGWSRSVSVSSPSQHEGMFLQCRYQSFSSAMAMGFFILFYFLYIRPFIHVSLRLTYGTLAPKRGRIQGPTQLIGFPRSSQ